MDPYAHVRGLDNLAAAAFYNIAIKRSASESPSGPHWYDPVPRSARYPWSEVRVPEVKGAPVSNIGRKLVPNVYYAIRLYCVNQLCN